MKQLDTQIFLKQSGIYHLSSCPSYYGLKNPNPCNPIKLQLHVSQEKAMSPGKYSSPWLENGFQLSRRTFWYEYYVTGLRLGQYLISVKNQWYMHHLL